jgi:hypothetical protein
MTTREHILSEIRRTATENGGAPLGLLRFVSETGIPRHHWFGKYWANWGEAVREAGLEPNAALIAIPESQLLENLASLAREKGRFPTTADQSMKARRDPTFPELTTFRRLGAKAERAAKLRAFCVERGWTDVAGLCDPHLPPPGDHTESGGELTAGIAPGYVYLLKHGSRREYKIGRTNNPLRRDGEIRTELPNTVESVHKIKTDDPSGIEAYWHQRFAAKRLNGEWFELSKADVAAFKRWRNIY